MRVQKKDIYFVKLRSMKSTIEKTFETQKKEHIAINLGEKVSIH